MTHYVLSARKRRKQVFIFLVNAAPQRIYAGCTWHETDTLDYSLEICKNHEDVLITDWIIRGSALGPTGGLSARQLNSCLPRREEKTQCTG